MTSQTSTQPRRLSGITLKHPLLWPTLALAAVAVLALAAYFQPALVALLVLSAAVVVLAWSRPFWVFSGLLALLPLLAARAPLLLTLLLVYAVWKNQRQRRDSGQRRFDVAPDTHALRSGQDDFVTFLGDHDIDQLVSFTEPNSNDSRPRLTAEGRKFRLFHQTLSGRHHEVLTRLIEIAHRPGIGDALTRSEVQQIDNGPSPTISSHLGKLVNLPPINFA